MNLKKAFGIIGIAAAALLLMCIAISIIVFENGVFSPFSGFYSELGQYPGGYLSVSSALIFNIGMMLFGIALCAFMVFWGMLQNTWACGAVSFFGILTGVLIAAMALIPLNFARYHYIAAAACSVAMFVFGASYIVTSLSTGRRSIAPLLVAFFTAVCGALFAGYVINGGMRRVFIQDASLVGRLSFMPFAVMGWLSLLLLMALLVLLSVELLLDRPAAQSAYTTEKARRSYVRGLDF